MRSFDFLSENTRSRLPVDDEGDDIDAFTEDVFAERASRGLGNTTAYNEYKAFGAEFSKYTEADPAMHSLIMKEYHRMQVRIREEFHKRHPARVPSGAATTTLTPVRMNMLHLHASRFWIRFRMFTYSESFPHFSYFLFPFFIFVFIFADT